MGNWYNKHLGELILDIKDGGTPNRSISDYFGGEIPWVVIDDIKDEIHQTKENLTELGLKKCSSILWDEGDLILSTGATIGIVGITKIRTATKQGICGIKTKSELIDNNFLKYWFQLNRWQLLNNAQGSTIKEIRPSTIAKLRLDIPDYLPEQTRIAEILSTADEAIAHTEALIAKYQRIKTGLMQDLLTRGIDENGNIRSKATHKFVVKNGIEVPEEWEVVKLIDCVDKSTIITYGIVQTGLHVIDGVRVLRTVDLKKDKIDSSNLLRTTEEISNSYKRTILKKFDLVCNVRASVGDFNIIDDDDLVGCNTTRGVARISPKKEINPYYLLWFLRSERNTKQMELLIKGTTFIDINIADLREIWIPIPNNKSEQDKIAEKLIQITDTLQDYNRQLLKLQSLKTGLMQDLLSGKVRVKIKN